MSTRVPPGNDATNRFVPALRFRVLTRFFDPIVRLTMREQLLRGQLVEQLQPEPGHAVVDLGCGTGSLAIAVRRRYPDARVFGVDLDPDVLAIARRKVGSAGVQVPLLVAPATALPLAPGSLDRVVSSLVFHHLGPAEKRAALRSILAALRPGGQLHLADFGKPEDLLMRLAILPVRMLDGFDVTADNVAGRLVAMMEEAGFRSVEETARVRTMFGVVVLHRAVRP